jgi:ankyrin repeat protein
MVRKLALLGVEPNGVVDGIMPKLTPLMYVAARSGDCPTAQALLDCNVALDARDLYGCTALMLAAANGRADLVALLLKEGADTAVVLDMPAFFVMPMTAYLLAQVHGHHNVLEVFRAFGIHG